MSNAEELAKKWVDENYTHPLDVDPYKCYIAGYNEAQQELADLKAENSMLVDFINAAKMPNI